MGGDFLADFKSRLSVGVERLGEENGDEPVAREPVALGGVWFS
jgi:hypothetical protein